MTELSAKEIVRMVQFECLNTREAKGKIYDMFRNLSPEARNRAYENGRDRYLAMGVNLEHSNTLMLLDVAADLPDADDLEEGLIDSLRPDTPEENHPDDSKEMMVKEDNEVRSKKKRTEAELEAQVRILTKAKTLNLSKSIIWISSNLGTKPENIDLDEIPSMWAWTTYLWSRGGMQTEYHRLYGSKLIPTGGLGISKDLGFVDDGSPIDAILIRMRHPVTGISANDVIKTKETENDV